MFTTDFKDIFEKKLKKIYRLFYVSQQGKNSVYYVYL